MPKLKTKSGVKKRLRITALGRVNAKYIRQNRGTKVMADADAKAIKHFMPYG